MKGVTKGKGSRVQRFDGGGERGFDDNADSNESLVDSLSAEFLGASAFNTATGSNQDTMIHALIIIIEDEECV